MCCSYLSGHDSLKIAEFACGGQAAHFQVGVVAGDAVVSSALDVDSTEVLSPIMGSSAPFR